MAVQKGEPCQGASPPEPPSGKGEKMRRKLEVRLNETLEKKLEKIVEKTGLNRSEIVRYLIAMQSDKAPSKSEILKLQRELAAIGNNLNQIARALNKCVKHNEQIDTETFKKILNTIYELQNKLESYKK